MYCVLGDDLDEVVIKLFTRVTRGYGAVINADVVATVSSTVDTTQVTLYDTGMGTTHC